MEKIVGTYKFEDFGPGVKLLETSGEQYVLQVPVGEVDTLSTFFSERSTGDVLELTGEILTDVSFIGGGSGPVFRVTTAQLLPLE